MRYNGIIVFLGALTLAFSAGAQSLRDRGKLRRIQ